MGETRRLIKNTGIIAIGGVATKLVQFMLLPLYTSVLSTSEYGTVDYVNTIALFLVPAVSLLMDEAMFRFLIDCKNDFDRIRIVTSSFALFAAGCLVFALAVLLMQTVWPSFDFGWVLALVVSQCLMTMASSLMRGFGDTVSYALMNFLASAITIVLNVAFIAVAGLGVLGMLSATIIAQGGVALFFLVRKKFWRYLDLWAFAKDEAKELIRYSIPLIPNKVSWTIMNMLDRLIIMNAIGADAAGVYAVSYKFPSVMDQIYGFFYQSWKESSARALEGEEDISAFYNAVYRVLRRFMMAIVLVMTALMPLVYGVLIKGSFNEGLFYVPILLLATYYSNMSGFYGGIFTAYKDTGIMGTTTVVSALLCAALCVLMIPLLGLYGASIATVAATFVVNEYRRIKVEKYIELTEDLTERVLTIMAVVGVFISFYTYSYGRFAPALVICLLIAFAYFVLMNKDVLKKILAIVRRRRR